MDTYSYTQERPSTARPHGRVSSCVYVCIWVCLHLHSYVLTYSGKTFDSPTAWRIAKECALGCEALHALGYMHRNINSL